MRKKKSYEPKWKGPRNVPERPKALARRRKRAAQRITREAYNGQ